MAQNLSNSEKKERKKEFLFFGSKGKILDCSHQIENQFLLQVKEFKYLGVLCLSEVKMKREIDRWIGAASAIMWIILDRFGQEEAEPQRQSSQFTSKSMFQPTSAVIGFG